MSFYKTCIPLILVWAIALPLYATQTLTYGPEAKVIAGVKITLTESDGTITILSTDTNGQVTLPTTSNTYTLAASLAETGEDPVDLLDAIWILQHSGELRTLTANQQKAADVNGDGEVDLLDAIYILQHSGELRTLSPNLIFLDTNTGNALSETTFSPGDTPSITVIRTGDVDQGFDPTLITDHAPILTGKTTLSIDENETSVATLTATDVEGDAVTYSLSGTDAASLSINASSGVLTFDSAPDYETKTSYSITVNISDGTFNTKQDITISITNLQELPTVNSINYIFESDDNSPQIFDITDSDNDEIEVVKKLPEDFAPTHYIGMIGNNDEILLEDETITIKDGEVYQIRQPIRLKSGGKIVIEPGGTLITRSIDAQGNDIFCDFDSDDTSKTFDDYDSGFVGTVKTRVINNSHKVIDDGYECHGFMGYVGSTIYIASNNAEFIAKGNESKKAIIRGLIILVGHLYDSTSTNEYDNTQSRSKVHLERVEFFGGFISSGRTATEIVIKDSHLRWVSSGRYFGLPNPPYGKIQIENTILENSGNLYMTLYDAINYDYELDENHIRITGNLMYADVIFEQDYYNSHLSFQGVNKYKFFPKTKILIENNAFINPTKHFDFRGRAKSPRNFIEFADCGSGKTRETMWDIDWGNNYFYEKGLSDIKSRISDSDKNITLCGTYPEDKILSTPPKYFVHKPDIYIDKMNFGPAVPVHLPIITSSDKESYSYDLAYKDDYSELQDYQITVQIRDTEAP